MTRQEMMETMSNTEFLEWVALERIDPLPDQMMMWRWQMAAATGRKPDDFWTVQKPSKKTDVIGIKARFMALAKPKR